MLVEVQLAPMCVAVLKGDRHTPRGIGPPTPDLVLSVFEAVGKQDPDPMLGSRDGVKDRLAAPGGNTFRFAKSPTGRHIHVDADRCVDRRGVPIRSLLPPYRPCSRFVRRA